MGGHCHIVHYLGVCRCIERYGELRVSNVKYTNDRLKINKSTGIVAGDGLLRYPSMPRKRGKLGKVVRTVRAQIA